MLKTTYSGGNYNAELKVRSADSQGTVNKPFTWNICEPGKTDENYAKLDLDFANYSVAANTIWLAADAMGGNILRWIIAYQCRPSIPKKIEEDFLFDRPLSDVVDLSLLFEYEKSRVKDANFKKCSMLPQALSLFLNIIPLGVVVDYSVQYQKYMEFKKEYPKRYKDNCEKESLKVTNDVENELYNCSGTEMANFKEQGDCKLNVHNNPNKEGIAYYKYNNTGYDLYTSLGFKLITCYNLIEGLFNQKSTGQNYTAALQKMLGKTNNVTCPENFNLYNTFKNGSPSNLNQWEEMLEKTRYNISASSYIEDNKICSTPRQLNFNSAQSAERPAVYNLPVTSCDDNSLPICGQILKVVVDCGL